MDKELQLCVEMYLEYIKGAFIKAKWTPEMYARFTKSIRLDIGKAYIKVVSNDSVHSFIVLSDGKQFKRGDILKAAGWRAPAKNFARGNILTRNYGVISWSGA